ncbi:hypothetical protein A4X06_0g5258 [Tilletia controversa]|uniref:Uncharacterized protein n=1 Tax=Tilletia controversa TaxID=13291 RepID=A0A8X7SVQ8_9BASI|nr:hypothetical protein A4X06_0g5258 [Tilletia controversa]
MATANTATTPTDMGTRRTRPADPRSWSAPLKSSIRPTFASTSVLPSSIVEDAVHDAHSIPVGAHMPALINPLDAINLRQEEEDLFRSEIDNINFKVYNIGQLKSIYDTAAYQLPRWSVDFGQKFSDIVQQVAYFRITGTWLPLPPVADVYDPTASDHICHFPTPFLLSRSPWPCLRWSSSPRPTPFSIMSTSTFPSFASASAFPITAPTTAKYHFHPCAALSVLDLCLQPTGPPSTSQGPSSSTVRLVLRYMRAARSWTESRPAHAQEGS